MTPRLRLGRVPTAEEFLGLFKLVKIIAPHPDFPGKRDVVEECVEDIGERTRQGRLTPSQREELLALLTAGA
jgi:hypothetical protein